MAARKLLAGVGVASVLAVAFVLYVRWSVEQRRLGGSLPPAQTYEALIASPIPPGVSAIQGAGTTWQGYDIYLRFEAPSLEAGGVTAPPYEAVDCERVEGSFHPPDHLGQIFTPDWSIATGPDRVCLVAYEVENERTRLGTHHVMFANGRVLFAGSGS